MLRHNADPSAEVLYNLKQGGSASDGFWKTRKGGKSVSLRKTKIVFHLEFVDDTQKNYWKDIETSPLYHMSVVGRNQLKKNCFLENSENIFFLKIDLKA